MSHYLDTSVLVSALTPEPHTPRVQEWLGRLDPAVVVISDWTITEVASALSRKLRKREITDVQRVAAQGEFEALQESAASATAVSRADFRAAARIVERHDLGLRSGDALHLAVAKSYGSTLWTLDQRLLGAGTVFGITIANPLET